MDCAANPSADSDAVKFNVSENFSKFEEILKYHKNSQVFVKNPIRL